MKHFLLFLLMFSTSLGYSQTTCDSLDIILVNVDAFTSNQINIQVVNNNSQEIFDYPGFRVFDEDDNLIGEEEVFYFGIGGQSMHVVTFPDSLFNFSTGTIYDLRLELWTGFYSELACEFNVSFPLIPSSFDCLDIEMTFTEFSDEEVSYDLLVVDWFGSIFYEETLVFAPTVSSIDRNFCLSTNGCYNVSISFTQPDPSNMFISLVASNSYGFLSTLILDQQTTNNLSFSLWNDCSNLNSIGEIPDAEEFQVVPNPVEDNLKLPVLAPGTAQLWIYNTIGETILELENTHAQSGSIDLSNLLSGLYIIKIKQDEQFMTGKFIKL